jgi:hypothetical protein
MSAVALQAFRIASSLATLYRQVCCVVGISGYFSHRADYGYGGAVSVNGGAPSFSNCTFISNIAGAFCCHVDIDERVLTLE